MGPRGCLLRVLGLLCLALPSAALRPKSPGYAVAVNHRTNTEYVYSYPRRLYRTFTVELWVCGTAPTPIYHSYLSVAHPRIDNLLLLAEAVFLLGVPLMSTPACPPGVWCHIAVSVDLSNFPALDLRTYKDGRPLENLTAAFPPTVSPALLEEETLGIVLGQDQDSVLGGFDTLQVFSGHMDELRLWSTVRTAEEIFANYHSVLATPYPAALASYYTFDNMDWDATYYEDKVNNASQYRLYAADYTSASTSPTLSPAYAPPTNPLPRLAVSSAPLCSAPGADGLWVLRAAPGGTLTVPATSLFCGNASNTSVAVTSVSGGLVSLATGQGALNVPIAGTGAVTFAAATPGLPAGAGFNFTATNGAATIAGRVLVWPNAAPTLAPQLSLMGEEDVMLIAWITASDADRDLLVVEVAAPPDSGVAAMDGAVNRAVQYQPAPNANGINVTSFTLRARDIWGAASSGTMSVTVSLKPVVDAPSINMTTTFTMYRGQRIAIPFRVVDVDGNDPFVIASDWPTSAQGFIEGQEQGRTWVINECSASSKLQWADGYGNWSSSYGPFVDRQYGISQIVGQPTSSSLGDWIYSWCPATIDGGCVNRATPKEALTTFYTEFVEAHFATPMYLTGVILVENYGGDRTSRVLVPSDRDPSKWKAIMTKDLASTPAAASVKKYSVESLPVCRTLWPVDQIRLEFDTCHRDGWFEVDAVQIRGGVMAQTNVLNATTQLYFRATPGYTGTVSFGLTATSCYGLFEATSDPLSVTVAVRDTPHVIVVEVRDWWFVVDVGQLDSGPRDGNVLVLELPTYGALRYNGRPLNATLQDLGSHAPTFEYRPFHCDAQLQDSFLVQLGPMAVVQVNVQGCATLAAQLIPIVVPSVVVPVALALLAGLWWRLTLHSRRDNSGAPKDPKREICVVFTDIQASTMLWGEAPHVMAAALDAHHAIIRKLIAKYKCYEVKTIGDSFMVVCAEVHIALQLALSIQEALYGHDWDASELDEFYRRQTACQLCPAAYARLWNGLRVRVGLHCGQAQITFDETTKGYDYYGTVVNAAARIEGVAHGGQIVASEDAYRPAADHCRARGVVVRPLGAVQLSGLPNPLDLVQLLPASLGDRTFPPLRMERGGDDAEDSPEEGLSDCPTGMLGSPYARFWPHALDREVLLHPLVRSGAVAADTAIPLAHYLYYALKSLLNMHQKPNERRKRLQEVCRQWHVPCCAGTERLENATVGRLALQLIGSVVSQMNTRSRSFSMSGHFPDDASLDHDGVHRGALPPHPEPQPHGDGQHGAAGGLRRKLSRPVAHEPWAHRRQNILRDCWSRSPTTMFPLPPVCHARSTPLPWFAGDLSPSSSSVTHSQSVLSSPHHWAILSRGSCFQAPCQLYHSY